MRQNAPNQVRQSPAREWSLHRIQSDSELIKYIQRYRTPFLDGFFRVVALFGDEIAFTLGLPVLGWSVPADVIVMVILAWCFTFYVGHSLKDLLQLPRPFVVDRDVACLEHHFSGEYGLPSTHAQAVWCIPTTLILSLPQDFSSLTTLWLVAIPYALLVSFSRLYLGVHSLLDVIVGSILGFATSSLLFPLHTTLRNFLLPSSTSHLAAALLTIVAVHVALCFLYPRLPGFSTTFRDTCAIMGVSTGVLGALACSRAFRLPPACPITTSPLLWTARVFAGLLTIVVLHEIVKRGVWIALVAARQNWTTWWSSSSSSSSSSKEGKTKARRESPEELKTHMPLVAAYKYISYIGIGAHSAVTVPLVWQLIGL